MNLVALDRALRQLRLSGMAAVLDTRLRQTQAEKMAPIDLVSALVADELRRRQDRLLERRHKLARFRDPERALDTFDFDFNKKMNRALVYELATTRFIAQREDVLPRGTGRRPAPDRRRPRHAQALPHRRRRSPRADHAPLRAGSTMLTSNRPVDDWGKLLGDTAAVTALLDRLLHHAPVLTCGPRSWRTKLQGDLPPGENVR
jgi:DNA replication protein DnaC